MAERNTLFIRPEIQGEEEDYGRMDPVPALSLVGVPTKINKAFPSCPTSGFEYLRMVQLQREELTNVNSVNRSSPSVEASCMTPTVAPVSNKKKRRIAPDSKYQKSGFLCDVREQYRIVKNKLKDELCPKRDVVIPSISDERAWCAFCLGREALLKLQGINHQEEDAKSTHHDFDSEGYQPLMSYVLQISEDDIPMLLKYHLSWMKQLGFSHRQGEWIFALMVLLKKPLNQIAFDALLDMSKICSQLLCSEKEDDIIEGLKFFVNQINRYFFASNQPFVPCTSNFKTVCNEDSSSDDEA